MKTAMAEAGSIGEPEIALTRIFEAPRALVWEAITNPKHLAEWFGPHGVTNANAVVELREGGEYSTVMKGPGGFERKAAYTITEIAPINRLVLETSGGRDPSADDYFRVRMIFDLSERGTQTILTLNGHVLAAGAKAKGPFTGGEGPWGQSLERLGGRLGSLTLALPEDRPISIITRLFDAPRELMWTAMTDANHLQHWWGPRAMTNILCEIDARPGGKWRVHQRVDAEQSPGGAPKGSIFKFHGEIREVVPPEKVVQTFGMEGMFEDQTIVETMTLTDLGNGKTLLKVVSLFEGMPDDAAFAARKGMVNSGMSYGANETYQRLEEYLAAM